MNQKHKESLLAEKRRLESKLQEVSALLEKETGNDDWSGWSFRERKIKCGKTRCKKCQSGERHGGYWYAYRRENGKTKSYYVGKDPNAWKADNAVRFGIKTLVSSQKDEPVKKTDRKPVQIYSQKVLACLKQLETIKEVFVDSKEWKQKQQRPFNLAGSPLEVLSFEATDHGSVLVTVQRGKGCQIVVLNAAWLFFEKGGELCPLWV